MTFDQLWNSLVAKKPELTKEDATCTFTSANLKKLLRQTYEQGEKKQADRNKRSDEVRSMFDKFM